MSKRSFPISNSQYTNGTIKSLLHFDFPYYNEPNDGLGDEVGIATWTRAGNFKLAGSIKPYAVSGEPKFGWRCGYFPDNSSYITGANNDGVFDIKKDGLYCFCMYLKRINNGSGTFFTIGDYAFGINSSGYFTCGDAVNTGSSIGNNTWVFFRLVFNKGGVQGVLNGGPTLGSMMFGQYKIPALTNDLTPTEIKLGGGLACYIDEFFFAEDYIHTSFVFSQPNSGTLDVSKVGGFGTGEDGDVTISADTQINSYGLISSITDAKTFAVSSWSNGTYTPTAGREIMIHITTSKQRILATYPNVGLYAFGKIASINGTTVTLEEEITTANGYDFTLASTILSDCYVQVITVPNFNTLTVNATVTPLTWKTSTGGGIVAFRVKEDCTINGSILTHGYGNIRGDLHQMENSKLIDRFLCSHGGGIFATCGGTFTTSENARLGASWSGLGYFIGNIRVHGAAGYGGYGHTKGGLASKGNETNVGGGNGGIGFYTNSSGSTTYSNVSGTIAGETGANTSTSTIAANSYGANGGGGCGGNGGNCAAKGVSARPKVAGSGGGGQGGSSGSSGSANGYTYAYGDYDNDDTEYINKPFGVNGGGYYVWSNGSITIYGGAGGGAPGGDGGVSFSGRADVDNYSNSDGVAAGIAGACIILIAKRTSITQESISTGGSAAYNKYCGCGGTGFCYIAAGELV